MPLISVSLSKKSCYCYLSPLKELSYTEFSGLLPGRSHDDIKNEVKRSVELANAAYTSPWKYFKSLMFIKGVTTSTLLFQHLILKKNYEKPAKKIKAEEAKEFEKVAIDVKFMWKIVTIPSIPL